MNRWKESIVHSLFIITFLMRRGKVPPYAPQKDSFNLLFSSTQFFLKYFFFKKKHHKNQHCKNHYHLITLSLVNSENYSTFLCWLKRLTKSTNKQRNRHMNKANSQQNYEVRLESIRNYLDHSLTHLTPTVPPKPHRAISSERVTGKSIF